MDHGYNRSNLLCPQGTKIWISHPDLVWEGATVQFDCHQGDGIVQILTDSGTAAELLLKPDGSNFPPLQDPSALVGHNDLASMSFLHEPGVLNNLKFRFGERHMIYTYSGIILIAINPYAELPLYGARMIHAYRGRSIGELEPHIFALAEEAYSKLERENCNVSIIISGESGAGKTVSAKHVMRYIAAAGGSESETQVERKVLASSVILEAFGNAKTIRNDNSSRFGKFTKLLFEKNVSGMKLIGAAMHTYLLEKSRVVFQAHGEHNYHIFYQLCSARDLYPELELEDVEKFDYLRMGLTPEIERLSDEEKFRETIQSMHILGFSDPQIADILNTLSGILHLGNIKFIEDTNEVGMETCDIPNDDLNLHLTGKMLKINTEDLRRWLNNRKIESVRECMLIPNNIAAARAAKDALVKHIYAKLFQHIVEIINKSLNTETHKQNSFIGVLDIYGFEKFDTNSFEQLCINYANEKLQQQFNRRVFKFDQEEYLREGIAWTMIDFYDNQPCIDLIESKLGVLDLLDDECKMPKGTDETWVGKLYEKCNKYTHFQKARFGTTSFIIKHFSDTVEYNVYGFLEKNRDTVSRELVSVIRNSEMLLCKQLMEMEAMDTLGADAAKVASLGEGDAISDVRQQIPSKLLRCSVSSEFRKSLSSLMSTLNTTTPLYVRCIKPNDVKGAFKWEPKKIVQQLRACGLLETVRISAEGFPSRWLYFDFFMRYQLLCHRSKVSRSFLKISCCNIVTKWIKDEDKYRFGYSEVFFRAGQVAFLEQVRSDLHKNNIIIVQSVVRCYIYRRRYTDLRYSVCIIQRYARSYLAREKARHLREEHATLIISKHFRGWLCRRHYIRLRKTVCGIQKYARGMLARKHFRQAMENYGAIQIQRFVRGYLARRTYHMNRRAVIVCQSAARRFLARRLFKRIKAEARNIFHVQNINRGLEKKIMTLQQKIDQLNQENVSLKSKTSEIPALKMKLEDKHHMEIELKRLRSEIAEKDSAVASLRDQLETEKSEKVQLLEETAHNKEEWEQGKKAWRLENKKLRLQIGKMCEDEARKVEIHEKLVDEMNAAYQCAIKDKEILENVNYVLMEELRRGLKSDSRSVTSVSSEDDDDIRYLTARSTIGTPRRQLTFPDTPPNASRKDEDDVSYISAKSNVTVDDFGEIDATSTPNTEQLSLILKLRNRLKCEKKKNQLLNYRLDNLMTRYRHTEPSKRLAELDDDNEELRIDCDSSCSYASEKDETIQPAEDVDKVIRNLDYQHLEKRRLQNLIKAKFYEMTPNSEDRNRNEDRTASFCEEESYFDINAIQFNRDDLDKILKVLVTDMKPTDAAGLLPGLPVYIIFMCMRYAYIQNSHDDMSDLINSFVGKVKAIHRTADQVEPRTLWLVNTLTLLNLTKQYGDLEEFTRFNTDEQNNLRLKYCNLYDCRRVLLDVSIILYQGLVNQLQKSIENFIEPAILFNDEIHANKQVPTVHEPSASLDYCKSKSEYKALILKLEEIYNQFNYFGLNGSYSEQIFYQLFYFVCAVAMNSLMLRGNICMWQTGMVIRYNLGFIENWLRSKKMSNDVLTSLTPLNQVSQLLQLRKTEDNIANICDLCTHLNTAQVVKVMQSYKLDDYEGEITTEFLSKLIEKLNARPMLINDEFVMDQAYIHPFKPLYISSDVRLCDVDIPASLELNGLLAKI